MQTLYGYKLTKRGKYRLYKSEPQAVRAWRGTNDKITVVREDDFSFSPILNFDTLEDLQAHCQQRFGTKAHDMSDW